MLGLCAVPAPKKKKRHRRGMSGQDSEEPRDTTLQNSEDVVDSGQNDNKERGHAMDGNGTKGSSGQGGEASNTQSQREASTEVTMIREMASDESISGVLRYCKNRILRPVFRLLGLMGLKPLRGDAPDLCTISLLLNKVHLAFVLVLLVAGYLAQYFTCFRRDCGFSYRKEMVHHLPSNNSDPELSILRTICVGNPIFSHVIPSLLHFLAFLYMIYIYRFTGDEQLQNLMERVFIQASQAHSSFFSQRRLLRTLQLLISVSILWLLASTAVLILQIATHDILTNIWIHVSNELMYAVLVTLVISTLWQDAFQVVVIVSYVIQCKLLSTYLDLLQSRIRQHSITLNECIKEIGELGKLLSHLNDDLSFGLGLLLLLNSALSISNVVFLITKGNTLAPYDLAALSISVLLWICLVLFPLFQAAKLSNSCKSVRELGHLVRMRPFGYQTVPTSELDSFLLFVSTVRLEVKILKVPVSQKIIVIILLFGLFSGFIWGLVIN